MRTTGRSALPPRSCAGLPRILRGNGYVTGGFGKWHLTPDNVQGVLDYMEIAARVNVDMPDSKDIDEAVVKAWAEYSVQNKDWLTRMGAKEFALFANSGRDPKWPGNGAPARS